MVVRTSSINPVMDCSVYEKVMVFVLCVAYFPFPRVQGVQRASGASHGEDPSGKVLLFKFSWPSRDQGVWQTSPASEAGYDSLFLNLGQLAALSSCELPSRPFVVVFEICTVRS